jgi:RimJ/RimL family protein N-acetyltransferase
MSCSGRPSSNGAVAASEEADVSDLVLKSPRLILRPACAEDAEDVYRNINDRDVIRMIARPPWPYPRELADVFVRTTSSSVIEHDGEVVGAISIDGRQHGYNLGFWLGRRHWGKGLMSEAAATLIEAFFADLGDVSLYSAYLLDNRASWRVQEKLGFVKVDPCRLDINSRGGEQPGMQTLLARAAFEARSQ